MTRSYLRYAFMLGIGLAIAGCQSSSLGGRQVDASEKVRSRQQYLLGPGDQVRVNVYGEDDLSGEFVVDDSGHVSMPLIGDIPAEHLSVRGLQRAIEASLKGRYLKNPQVSAEVLNYRPYYILGQVERPGEYPYAAGLTIRKAVAAAGGFTYRANTRFVYVKRAGSARHERYQLTATTPVDPGDEIEVTERLF